MLIIGSFLLVFIAGLVMQARKKVLPVEQNKKIEPEENERHERRCMYCQVFHMNGTILSRDNNTFFFCFQCRSNIASPNNLNEVVEQIKANRLPKPVDLDGNFELNLKEIDVLILDRILEDFSMIRGVWVPNPTVAELRRVDSIEIMEVKRKVHIFAAALLSARALASAKTSEASASEEVNEWMSM